MSILRNPRHGSVHTAALRVTHQSIRSRAWVSPVDPEHTTVGEVNHIEARGFIALDVLHQMSAAQCASLPPHDHCTTDDHDHSAGVLRREACCIIPETYPITIHFNAPVGDGVVPHLGDNLIITIRRAEGPEENAYDTEHHEIAPQLVGLPAGLRDAIARKGEER